MATLTCIDVRKQFTQADQTIEVLKGVSVEFEKNTSYAITGPSGSGKSTLVHLLAGLDDPDSGVVNFNGKDIAQLSQTEKQAFLNKSIGLVFQQPYLIKELNVVENVMLKGLIAGAAHDQLQDDAYTLLEQVGLTSKALHNPLALSGGEQQRVAIARALVNKPDFLIADEPTGNLDVATGKVIVDLMLACQKQWGMGIIVSSHDLYVAQLMHKTFQLESGKLK